MRHRAIAAVATMGAVLAGCAGSGDVPAALVRVPAPAASATLPPPAPLSASTTVEPSPTAVLMASTTTTSTAAPRGPRSVVEQAWVPFASVEGITLVHPSARVERVGFHQSNHEGAREMTALSTAVAPVTMESRERATGPRTAADVVVDPKREIRSPVSGVVKRAGGYVLYCRYRDEYVVVAPDADPSLEVKILHITGVVVRTGDRVVAGETAIARAPTPLPFDSQVDELRTADPRWPHTHIEVIDPSIPNITEPGGGC